MGNDRTKLLSIVLEMIMFLLLVSALILEGIYIFFNDVSMFTAIESILPIVIFYVLFSFMQIYPETWNLFIPVCVENKVYAIYLAKLLKLIFCGMILYTTVCDFLKQTSHNVVFWFSVLFALAIVVFCKYKMWTILNKYHPRK